MRFIVVKCAGGADDHGRHSYRYSHAGVSKDTGFEIDDYIRAPSMEEAKSWIRRLYPAATFSDEDSEMPHPWLDKLPEPLAINMTLRDHFAGQALASLGASWLRDAAGSERKGIARGAYELADAMLEARKR